MLDSVIVPAIPEFGAQTANAPDALVGPSWRHPCGTDESGLVIFTRTFYAPRIDLPLAAAGVGIGLVAGVLVGLAAGCLRGWLGDIVMRVTDNITTGQWWTSIFPGLGLVLAVAGFNLFSEGLERASEL